LKSDIKQLLDIGLTVEELTLMIQQNANTITAQYSLYLGKGVLRPFVLLTSSFYKLYFQIIITT
ncbi:hypothetical protein, partial [uncultured Holdemanella sp.]|uniref:hypothetical protein n=1 Tax=uncultured Holdemanella sp. TaxID=1763549 RepID=UPI0025EAB444